MPDRSIGTHPGGQIPVSPNNPCPFLRALVANGYVGGRDVPLSKLSELIGDASGETGSKETWVRIQTWLVAVIANGLWPLRVLKSAISGAVLDEPDACARQAVAIARTRLSKAKIVLMDEPTAAISVRQVAEVLDLIRRLRDQGIAIVLISHRMPDVFAVADRIFVLRRGRKVAEKPIAESSPEEVTGLITGAIHAA